MSPVHLRGNWPGKQGGMDMKAFFLRAKRAVCYKLYRYFGMHLPSSVNSKISQTIRYRLVKGCVAQCGRNVNIEHGAQFDQGLHIGDNSGVGVNCSCYGDVHIGDNVMMGPECILLPHSHAYDRLDIPMCEQGFQESKPIWIGNDVWIGTRVIIMPGIQVGDHCILGAGAVVTKNVPDYAVVGGCPARILRMRNEEKGESGAAVACISGE